MMPRFYYRVTNALKIGWWAFKNPYSLKESTIASVSTRTFSRNEVDRLLKVQRDKCAAKATHFANEQTDSPKIFNYVNSTPIEDF